MINCHIFQDITYLISSNIASILVEDSDGRSLFNIAYRYYLLTEIIKRKKIKMNQNHRIVIHLIPFTLPLLTAATAVAL